MILAVSSIDRDMKNTDSILMKAYDNIDYSIHADVSEGKKRGWRHILGRIFAVVGIVAGLLLFLVTLFIAVLPLWLTQDRLAAIVENQAEKYFNADVTIRDIRYSLWSSFPRFNIEMDSVRIDSKAFSHISAQERASLPSDADFLASAAHFHGAVNVIKLMVGRISLHDVAIDSLRVNIVSLNDSLSNYDIVRNKDNSVISVPRVTSNLVRLTNTQPITYYSAETKSLMKLSLSSANARRVGSFGNNYDMKIGGKVTFCAEEVKILDNFPFSLDGKIKLGFRPFSLDISDYSIGLGSLHGKVNLSMDIGDDVNVNKFDYSISAANLMEMTEYLPAKYLRYVSGINTDACVDIFARLTKPYRYSPSSRPSVAVDISVSDGRLSYVVNPDMTLSFDRLNMLASFVFDGDNPDDSYFDIRNMSIDTRGASLRLRGRISDLFGSPEVLASLVCDARLSDFARQFPALSKCGMAGRLQMKSDIAMTFPSLGNLRPSNVRMTTKAVLSDYLLDIPQAGTRFSGEKIVFGIESDSPLLQNGIATDEKIQFSVADASLHLERSGLDVYADGVNVCGNLKIAELKNGSPVVATLAAKSIKMSDSRQNAGGVVRDVTGTATVKSSAEGYGVDADVSGGSISVQSKGVGADLSGIKASCSLSPASVHHAGASVPLKGDLQLADIHHTPEYVTVKVPDALKSFVRDNDFSLGLAVKSGNISVKGSDSHNSIENLRLSVTNDSLIVSSLKFRSDTCRAEMKASVGNLRDIIAGDGPQIIPVDAELSLGTVNINDLAYNYEMAVERATGRPAFVKRTHSDIKPTASDSTAILIPKNLRVNLHASIAETIYTDLHLYNLAGTIRLDDGLARADSVRISSDFGHAIFNFAYDTRDVQKMNLQADAALLDVNVVKFFQNYTSLLLMMPQMKNLSGFVSARLKANVPVFPTMCVNGPDLNAEIDVTGRQLTVHQTPFIRKITRMMLIHDGGDIHIDNIKARAAIFDNLLEVYPFFIDFDRYKLELVGLNNFNGNLYYHIGIDKSPFPFGVGIIVEGNFHKPKLRFGSASYNPRHATWITENIEGDFAFNVPSQLHYFIREMIHRAALAAEAAKKGD